MYLRLTDLGNFDVLTSHMYDAAGNKIDRDLMLGDVVTINETVDNTVPGGVYTRITRVSDKSWITVMGHVLFDRSSKMYRMKEDRFRMQFEKLKAREVADIVN
ncbi:hypothetical protein VPHD479_0339 [Vibrio phage D479]